MADAWIDGMSEPQALDLEIRTIVVTTRAAARRHQETNNPELIAVSVERGLLLLAELEAGRSEGAVADADAIARARREISTLSEQSDAAVALSRPE